MQHDLNECDVVVVGCGIAGLSAAVSAQEGGMRVAVLERAPIEERGGNTRHTGAWLRMKNIDEVSEDFTEHFAVNAGGHVDPSLVHAMAGSSRDWPEILRAMSLVDPEVVETFAQQAPPTLRWIESMGVKFNKLAIPFLTSVQPRMEPAGGGLALVEALAARFEANGGIIHYQTAAQSLLRAEDGRVAGVRATNAEGRLVSFHAPAVVLGCGGFQGNAEMMTRYIGPRSLYLRTMSRGCHYNKGEGIRMALDIGAAPCGDFGSWHASPMDPRSELPGPSVYIYPYGVLVNARGQRFTDEAPGPTDETYESVSREIFNQPNGIAYAILDEKVEDVPNYRVSIRTDQPAIEAPSLESLAEKLSIPVDALLATVAQYNASCPDGGFTLLELDGMRTRGLIPGKSNWARPIDKPPFRAYPIISSIVFTFGGLKVNVDAQVIDTEGRPIPGLYAAGETMGLYYGNYTGATSVLKGAVFGRRAGLHAARRPNTV